LWGRWEEVQGLTTELNSKGFMAMRLGDLETSKVLESHLKSQIGTVKGSNPCLAKRMAQHSKNSKKASGKGN